MSNSKGGFTLEYSYTPIDAAVPKPPKNVQKTAKPGSILCSFRQRFGGGGGGG